MLAPVGERLSGLPWRHAGRGRKLERPMQAQVTMKATMASAEGS